MFIYNTDRRMKRDPENAPKSISQPSASREGAKFKSEVMNASRKAHFLQEHSGQVEERLVNTVKS